MPSSYSCPRGNPGADADSISGPQRFGTPSVRRSWRYDEQTSRHHNTGPSPPTGRILRLAADHLEAHQVSQAWISLLCLWHPVAQ